MRKEMPILTQLFRPTRKEYEDHKLVTLFKRGAAFVLCSLFVLLGLGLIYVKPWCMLTCHHVGPEQTDCHLEKRIAWFLPTEERSIAGVSQADLRWERETRYEEDGDRTSVLVYDVLLVNDSGGVSLAGYDKSWSEIARSVADRVNLYLKTLTDKPLTVFGHGLWFHTLSTLGGAILLIFFAVVLLGSSVGSLLLVGAWTAEGVLSLVERVVAYGGRAPPAGGRFDRLRQALRNVAVPAQDED